MEIINIIYNQYKILQIKLLTINIIPLFIIISSYNYIFIIITYFIYYLYHSVITTTYYWYIYYLIYYISIIFKSYP
jgi:hypothetical protein